MSMINRNLDPSFVRTLEIMDTEEAAVYLRSTASTLSKLRHYGGGPIYIKQSARRVLYRRADLDAWLAERAVRSTSEAA